jgi:hypothetical protein
VFLCCKLQVFYLDIAYVLNTCCKCFICFRLMLHLSVSCYKCFMFQSYVQRVIGGTARALWEGARQARASGWDARRACSSMDGAWSSSSRLPPARRERRGLGRRSDGHGARRGGVRMRRGMRQARKDYNDTVGVRHVSNGPLGTVRWSPIPLYVRTPAIP